ncbi:hypothetical protein ACFE04_011379 [Oxalis oulophora]
MRRGYLLELVTGKSGTLVSGDNTGSVQFLDSQHGTLLQAHTCHKGDVNALATAPSHNRGFSTGSDGQESNVGNSRQESGQESHDTFSEQNEEQDVANFV